MLVELLRVHLDVGGLLGQCHGNLLVLEWKVVLLDPLLLHFLGPVLDIGDVVPHGQDAVVELLDGVVHLNDVLLADEAVPAGDQLVDLDELPWVVGVQEEQELVAQLSIRAWGFAFGQAVEVLHQILAGLHLIPRDDVRILGVVLALAEFIGVLEVGDGAVEVDLVEHDLLLGVILLLGLLLLHTLETLLGRDSSLVIHVVLDLFLVDDDGIGVILDGFVVAPQHEFGVGLAEVVLYHVVVAVLQRLTDVL